MAASLEEKNMDLRRFKVVCARTTFWLENNPRASLTELQVAAMGDVDG